MGVGIRYFVVDDQDNVMTLSKQRRSDIFGGQRGEPEWAGRTIRYLQVIVTVENRRVVRVHDVQAYNSPSTRKAATPKRRRRPRCGTR